MHQTKDRCGKWMIDHHGDAILKMAKIDGFLSWRAAHSELVAPRRLPDGLVEAVFPGKPTPDLFIIEIEAYADRSIAPQMFDDILLTRIEKGVVPDAIVLVLRPKGQLQVEEVRQESSLHGLTSLAASWRVIKLWELDAQDLLAANDVGLIPWVPLTRFTGPPGEILRQCREKIDRQAKPQEHEGLLAVTALLASVIYNAEAVLKIFGGTNAMIESPLVDLLNFKLRQDGRRSGLFDVLEIRFGIVPQDLAEIIRTVEDESRIKDLVQFAAICPDLEAFRLHLGDCEISNGNEL